MNFYNKQLTDFEKMYPGSTGTTAGVKSSNGLTGPDIAGIGMQLYGAKLQDRAAAEELERQKEQERLALLLRGREDRTAAQQFERGAQQTDRGLNMQGAQLLAQQRENAIKNRRLFSTRKAIAGAF